MLAAADDMTGANGRAWGPQWTTSFAGGAGTMDLQSNKYRSLTGGTGAYADLARAIHNQPLVDCALYAEITFDAVNNDQSAQFMLRCDGAWRTDGYAPNAGYGIQLSVGGTTNPVLWIFNGGGDISSTNGTKTVSINETWAVMLLCQGAHVAAKAWRPGTDAVPEWDHSVIDYLIPAGVCQWRTLNGSAGSAVDQRIDNFQLNNLAAPARSLRRRFR